MKTCSPHDVGPPHVHVLPTQALLLKLQSELTHCTYPFPYRASGASCFSKTLTLTTSKCCRFAESSEEGPGSMGASKPQPVPQVKTNAELQEACPPSSSICVFGLLDSTSQEHAAAVAALESASGRHRNFGFLWIDVPTQPSFASGMLQIVPSFLEFGIDWKPLLTYAA